MEVDVSGIGVAVVVVRGSAIVVGGAMVAWTTMVGSVVAPKMAVLGGAAVVAAVDEPAHEKAVPKSATRTRARPTTPEMRAALARLLLPTIETPGSRLLHARRHMIPRPGSTGPPGDGPPFLTRLR